MGLATGIFRASTKKTLAILALTLDTHGYLVALKFFLSCLFFFSSGFTTICNVFLVFAFPVASTGLECFYVHASAQLCTLYMPVSALSRHHERCLIRTSGLKLQELEDVSYKRPVISTFARLVLSKVARTND